MSNDQYADNHVWLDGEKCDCCDGTHPYHQGYCWTTETWLVNESIHKAALGRIAGMERREVTFRSEIDIRDGQIASLVSDLGVREDFVQRLMRELSQHGWGDFHYGPQHQDPAIVALLQEGGYKSEEQKAAELEYPHHAPPTALANYRAGREVWDTNGDLL